MESLWKRERAYEREKEITRGKSFSSFYDLTIGGFRDTMVVSIKVMIISLNVIEMASNGLYYIVEIFLNFKSNKNYL